MYPPPPQLAQPELDENNPISPNSQTTEVRAKPPERICAKGHKKLASFDPLLYIENERSSLGNFLATTTLFDDDPFRENEGESAPQELNPDKYSHKTTLSNTSFNFSQTSAEEKELATSDEISQRPPPPPQPSGTSNDYPMQSTIPCDAMAQQLPPRTASGYPSAPPAYSTDGYRIQCSSPTVSNSVVPPGTYPPTPPAYSSGGYPMQSISPVVSYSIVPPPPGAVPGYPPPSPVYTSGGYPMQSTSPVVSNAIAQPPPPMAPVHPPTPPGYYNYGTPPQAMWHPHHHQQQSPTLHSMHQPPPQHMQYSHTPYHNPQPYSQHCNQPSVSSAPPQPGGYNHAFQQQSMCPPVTSPDESYSNEESEEQKRSRRKCSVPNCPNRVVQGGLCISHGAKRKTCSHPGCTKNVKKGGMCSTHGPARKRCEFKGCSKVSVQGGRCIAHGAKKKVCCIDECKKQVILSGMCKKHYEANNDVQARSFEKNGDGTLSDDVCTVVDDKPEMKGSGHHRGLSIFQDNDLMNTIINDGAPASPSTPPENDGLHGLSIF